jgi:hypothetical protein
MVAQAASAPVAPDMIAGDPNGSAELPAHVQVLAMASAIWKARAVFAMAHLGLADLLGEGDRSVGELAAATSTHAGALFRLLRALGCCGLTRETEPQRFALTTLGAALKTGAPGAARATVLTLAGDWQWKAWENFLYSITTGEPGLRRAFGQNLFDYLAANPQDNAHFNMAMVALHGDDGPALAAAYDFGPLNAVADLGGDPARRRAGSQPAFARRTLRTSGNAGGSAAIHRRARTRASLRVDCGGFFLRNSGRL